MAFSTDLQHTRYNTPVTTAGHINSMVYGLSILLSPLMGFLMDKFGKILWVLSFGISMLITGLLIIGLTDFQPYLGLCFIGVAYSCIPNAIWPCIPVICGEKMSGTAFGGVTGMNSVGTKNNNSTS
jgi:MFS family permease